jgi:short-subunit dehydrogenase
MPPGRAPVVCGAVEIVPGTRAFITGASSGIGRALAQALAARGAVVGLAARREDDLRALAADLPGEHVVVPCDVSDTASTEAAIEGFVERAGGLDLLVANAGITHYGPFRDQPLADALRMSEVNWHGTLRTVHFGLPHLLDRADGHIVVVSSGAALRSFPWAAVYGGTKAAQRLFAEALRHELSGTGVSLTTVYPGEIATSLHDHEHDRMPDWYRGGARAAAPEALAAKVLEAVEADRRSVYFPPIVRLLQTVHNVSPKAGDALLRTLRGGAAAPRRD